MNNCEHVWACGIEENAFVVFKCVNCGDQDKIEVEVLDPISDIQTKNYAVVKGLEVISYADEW